jgi:hypothetical protein
MTDSTEQNTTVSISQVRIEEARENVAKALAAVVKAQERADAQQAKLDSLINAEANAAELNAITKGYVVSFPFGRAEKRRSLTGTVIAVGDDPKQGRMLVVAYGEGLDASTAKIAASDVTEFAAA